MNRPWIEYLLGETPNSEIPNRFVRIKVFSPEFEVPKMDEWRYFVLSAKELTSIRKGENGLNLDNWTFIINCGYSTSFYYDMRCKGEFFQGVSRYRSFHVAEQRAMTLLKKQFSQTHYSPISLEDRQKAVANRLRRFR